MIIWIKLLLGTVFSFCSLTYDIMLELKGSKKKSVVVYKSRHQLWL